MSSSTQTHFEPRKTPLQSRSAVTVEAIFEATVQVLLRDGLEKLTTTKIAERAGVSVGTLYQYYPHKQALLHAVLSRHLGGVTEAIEEACEANRGQSLKTMVRGMVTAFLDAKMLRREVSLALYVIASDLGSEAILASMRTRVTAALTGMLKTAPQVRFPELEFTAFVFYSSLAGAMRAFMEAGASGENLGLLRKHLMLMGETYLEGVATCPQ